MVLVQIEIALFLDIIIIINFIFFTALALYRISLSMFFC